MDEDKPFQLAAALAYYTIFSCSFTAHRHYYCRVGLWREATEQQI